MGGFKTQAIATGVAAACMIGAYATSAITEGGPGFPSPPDESKVYPQVTTAQPKTGTFVSTIKGHGEISPVQHLNLAAGVSGEIVEISPTFKSGERLNVGDVLLRIDDAEYREAVASAKSELAAAEVTLLQEKINREQAKTAQKRSGISGSQDSKLVLLRAAQAAVDFAQRSLERAQLDLAKTVVRAPFNALVISRSIELGSYVQTGSELGVLYGTDQVELILPLSTDAWGNLPELPSNKKDWKVALSDTESESQWNGYVDRVAQHIDSNTRQRALIVRVDDPLDQTPKLYPGTFIEADIPGKPLEGAWEIPALAVTQNNEIWFVDGEKKLAKAPAYIRLRMMDKVYLKPSTELENPLVVTHPLASYLPGMRVETTTSPDGLAALSVVNEQQKAL